MSLLTPSFGLLFWMLLSFAAVFGLLAKFGFPVITKAVNERRDYIQQSLAKADEANRTLENIKQRSDEIIADAKMRRTELIRQATAESNRIVQKAKDEAVVAGKQKFDEAMRLIEMQRQKAMGEMRTQAAALSVGIAEKILRRQLELPGNHEQLIGQFLDEMENGGA